MGRAASSRSVEVALEELFGASPAEFTRTRARLAKALKAEDAEAAKRVAATRKPTQTAYVLNQLSRRHPDEIAALVDLGRELEREHRRALRGGSSGSFRAVIDRQRAVIRELLDLASATMKELGIEPAGRRDEVATALQAALADPAVGAALEAGRLDRAPDVVASFGGLGAGARAPAPEREKPSPGEAPERKPRVGAAKSAKTAKTAKAGEAAQAETKAAKAREDRRERTRAAREKREKEREERTRRAALEKARARLRAAHTEATARRREAAAAERRAQSEAERASRLAKAAEESARREAEAREAVARLAAE